MNTRIKTGVMGCASFAQRSAIPALQGCPEYFELVGVASRTAEKADQFAARFGCQAYHSYQDLLDDPLVELVYMPLPTGLHHEWVHNSLMAGKHVIVEKSMAMDLASAQSMANLATEKQLLLAENFMFLYHSQMSFVRKLLQDEVVGELRQVRAAFGFPPLEAGNFRFQREAGGGALLDAGAYTLKLASALLGSGLRVNSATLSDPLECGVDTLGAVHLQDERGISALTGFGFDNFYQCNFEIWGSAGKITAPRAFTAKPDFSPEIVVERQGHRDVHRIPPDDQFHQFLTALGKAIQKRNCQSFCDEAIEQARLISSVFATANE